MLAHPANRWRVNTDLSGTHGHRTKMSAHDHAVAFTEAQMHVVNPTNPGGALDNGVEDRLHVRWRTADDAEHLGGRCLVLQSLTQLCVALLDLLEEANILDRDD